MKSALIADGRVDASNINVDTSASTKTVVLKGSVPTAQEKAQAEAIARDKAEGYTITADLVTHFHPDHLGGNLMGHQITGAAELTARVPAKVYIHRAELPFVQRLTGLSASDVVPVDGGDDVAIGNLKITMVHTPGHTPGSQCFLVGNALVSGDTLFIGSCGRVDLPGSNPEDMYRSLTQVLAALPDETILYPGHNYADRPRSTLGDEKRTNMMMRFRNLHDFLSVMGTG